MTWRIETSCGFESDKIAALAVPYLQGRFLDIGCGMRKVWPSAIGIDNGHHFGARSAADMPGDGTDLSVFADGTMDAVFSSHTLEHFPRERVPAILKEWARVLKVGGHLVLYLPSANLYPKCGEKGANPDHKWDICPGDIEKILRSGCDALPYDPAFVGLPGVPKFGCGWELLESEERGETNEYSLFIVARKAETGWTENLWQRSPDGKKRALVCRFGAIGDQIVAASVLPGLKAQGYHVTYMTTPDAKQVLLHDPNIDEWWCQAKDYVPNDALGPYWETVRQRFDLFVNLSESVEGSLLTLPGRLQHGYADPVRRRLFGSVNYLERTAELADVPCQPDAARFYASEAETRWAAATRRAWGGGPVVAWAINGSSPHKVYPFTQIVIKWLLERSPAHVCLLADAGVGREVQAAVCTALERAGAEMARVHPMGGGAWSIRQALSFCLGADCVVGPETGPLNAVAMEAMPKVIYLSHSSAENLTKHWRNTTVLVPDSADAPCYPCHRLHYDWTHCHQDGETHAALCASAVKPEHIFEAVMASIGAKAAA